MKQCRGCGVVKPLDDFYTHPMMGDGHLNHCKDCKRTYARVRHHAKSMQPEWCDSERLRARDKYRRLYVGTPPVASLVDRGAHSAAKRAIPTVPAGMERHHWSYQSEHWRDCIVLKTGFHRLLHHYMSYDETRKQFRTIRGHLLDTRRKHVRYMVAAFNHRANERQAAVA